VAGLRDVVGREGFGEFMRIWTEDFEDFEIATERIIGLRRNRVLAITRQRGVGKGSRATVEMEISAIYKLKRRRIVQVELFLDPGHALQAAGLGE
jgi:hypothetical protein